MKLNELKQIIMIAKHGVSIFYNYDLISNLSHSKETDILTIKFLKVKNLELPSAEQIKLDKVRISDFDFEINGEELYLFKEGNS